MMKKVPALCESVSLVLAVFGAAVGSDAPQPEAKVTVFFCQCSGSESKAWTLFLEQPPPGSCSVYGSGGENKESDSLWPEKRRR